MLFKLYKFLPILIVVLNFKIKCIFSKNDSNLMIKYPTCDSLVPRVPSSLNHGKTCEIQNIQLRKLNTFFYNNNYYRRHEEDYIHELKFRNSSLRYIPANIFILLPEIRRLECRHCQLSNIISNTFTKAFKLNEIDFAFNNLTSLEQNFNGEATNLLVIDLSWNQISSINSKAFESLTNLTALNLSHNDIKTVESNIFRSLVALKILNMEYTQLKITIDDQLFENNKNLTDLYLNDNQIKNITNSAISKLDKLEILSLNSNSLEWIRLPENASIISLNISHNMLRRLNIPCKVQKIDASFNKLIEINVAHKTNMNSLELQLNKLENLNFINGMQNLHHLDVTQNSIINFNSTVFSETGNIKHLYLENTKLQIFDYQTFGHLNKIETLDISYNSLKNINFNVMSAFQNLQTLFIEGNDLTDIIELTDFRLIFPNLKLIGISHNLFKCQYLRALFKTLTEFKIEIYIESGNFDLNKPNFRGVDCIESDTQLNIINLQTNRTYTNIPIHSFNQNVHDNQQFTDNALKQRALQINSEQQKSLIENLQIQITKLNNSSNFQVVNTTNESVNNQDNLHEILNTFKLQYNNTQHKFEKLQLEQDIAIRDQIESINTRIIEIDNKFKAINHSLSREQTQFIKSQLLQNANNDTVFESILSDIRILMALLLITGIIFIILKCVNLYHERNHRKGFARSPNVIMDDF